MRVHIALVGKTKEPILQGIHQYNAIDKIYLLHSRGDDGTEVTAKNIKLDLEPFGIREIILKVIDPFSMQNIVDVITSIATKESTNTLYINITGGTNLMAGAATAASFFIGAQAYYIKDRKRLLKNDPYQNILVELPVPNIPYHTALEKTQLKILNEIASRSGKISNKTIADKLNFSPQIISYHVKELKKKKLINALADEYDSRKEYLYLTDPGKLVIQWRK